MISSNLLELRMQRPLPPPGAGQRVVFGDLFLADIRAYREQLLARVGLR